MVGSNVARVVPAEPEALGLSTVTADGLDTGQKLTVPLCKVTVGREIVIGLWTTAPFAGDPIQPPTTATGAIQAICDELEIAVFPLLVAIATTWSLPGLAPV